MRRAVRSTSMVLVLTVTSSRGVLAQARDTTPLGPRAMLGSPTDAIAYVSAKNRARSLLVQGRAADAKPLIDRVITEYPRDPGNWTLLARVERALGHHLASAAAFERAGELGGWISDVSAEESAGINAVVEYLAAGDKRRALDALRREVVDRRSPQREQFYNWPGLEALQGDSTFRAILKREDASSLGRTAGWTRDVDFLYAEVRRVIPGYQGRALPDDVVRRYEALKRDIPKLSDEEIFIGMGRMLAPLRQGHTLLFLVPKNRYVPLQFYAFPEGVFIVGADSVHRELVGARVEDIGGAPVDEVLKRLSEARSADGDFEHLWGASNLSSAYHLRGVRATTRVDSIPLTLTMKDGATRRVLVPTLGSAPAERQDRLAAPVGVAAPLFLSDLGQMHWERPLPEHDALYVQMNNVVDDSDESLWNFGLRLRKVLADQHPRNLIIDLRHNNGGSTNIYTEFLRSVVGFSQQPEKRVFVLIGRRTYSATANLITELGRLANAIFVGEASSECCVFHGDPEHITLPYSRIEGELSVYRWALTSPWDGRREVSPHIPVQLTAAAYFAGRDPALETIFRITDQR